MKIVYLIAALLISYSSFAQERFAKQFRDVVNDTANGFPGSRGEVKLKEQSGTGTVYIGYISLITLENTSKNNIKYIGNPLLSFYSYDALIADSVKESEGKKICNEWKDKITSLIESGFIIKKYEEGLLTPGKYGWYLSKGELDISIDLYSIENTDLNRVSLSISYTIYKTR